MTQNKNMTPLTITCLNIHCPERFSICCGARSRLESNMTKEQFICSDCGQKFVGGKCNVNELDGWKNNMINKCKHCGKEYNCILQFGLCEGCLNYEQHNQIKNLPKA